MADHYVVDGRRMLYQCPYCGRNNVEAHHARVKMCYDCASKLQRYHNLKHKLLNCPNNETSEQLASMIAGYRAAKARGLKVPRDIS